ncbi:cell division protein FtsZ [Sphingobium yanoikuyae]|uniref:Cell division protein FtsZ n=1 Tax=Sphingobium yanoikuyae TaxID=13690 RepID=A0AA43BBK1_SPHYA|nr:cell division protein FtsZ [Sphingobium yanoikuyae]MDH2131429.1 cell division protein FtsZ [Sphingobium yanoikuyae]MDH2150066.1 cell division protein FtsZ [Sphingobium yanoikuyae]MDH2167111.1 cell division protein FtsZ [Sphingobium yanoikuyae]
MSIEISPPHVDELKPRIAVIGVGGAGGNAIANMIAASVEGVDFIVANTDAQALNASPAERRIQLGPQITEGLGAGSRPEIGRAAAEETIITVEQALEGAHMCFITAGMGGGTGTGAAPVIAKAAREKGILTVGVVTKPFTFEGNRRMKSAESGIDELQKHVDTLIVIPNQNLFLIANPNTTFKEAFQMADEVLQQGVRSITDLMIMPGLINLDFADVRSVMGEMGKAMMGTGEAEGDGRALQAAEKAIANPLLDGVSMRGAKGVIVSIVGGDDMRLMEVDEAANHIRELVDPDANIIWGSAFNDNLNGKIRVSVVATGIDNEVGSQAAPLTQPFSFASRPAVAVPQTPRPAPVAAPAPAAPVAAAPAPVAAPEPEALELDVPEAPAPAPIAAPAAEKAPPAFAPARPAAVFSDEDPSQDELLLGAEAAEPTAPEAAPKPAQPAPRVATGGTLFERMAGLTRGSEKAPGAEEGTQGLDIPRFLNRQNNQ